MNLTMNLENSLPGQLPPASQQPAASIIINHQQSSINHQGNKSSQDCQLSQNPNVFQAGQPQPGQPGHLSQLSQARQASLLHAL
jgi:hypothetical protein